MDELSRSQCVTAPWMPCILIKYSAASSQFLSFMNKFPIFSSSIVNQSQPLFINTLTATRRRKRSKVFTSLVRPASTSITGAELRSSRIIPAHRDPRLYPTFRINMAQSVRRTVFLEIPAELRRRIHEYIIPGTIKDLGRLHSLKRYAGLVLSCN
jgi:hypothetical protein